MNHTHIKKSPRLVIKPSAIGRIPVIAVGIESPLDKPAMHVAKVGTHIEIIGPSQEFRDAMAKKLAPLAGSGTEGK